MYMIKLTQLKKLQVSKDFHFTSVTVQIVELYLDLSEFFFSVFDRAFGEEDRWKIHQTNRI